MNNQLIGYIAGLFTMFGFLPQIVKLYRTKSSGDVSVLTAYQLFIGTALWSLYAWNNGDTPLLINNAITNVLSIVVIIQYYIYRSDNGLKTR